MKKTKKIYIYLILLVTIILCLPSIIYLIKNQTVNQFDSYYTYTLARTDNIIISIISAVVVIGFLLIFGVLYLLIIKNEKSIFKNIKQIMLFIIIISALFTIMLPFLSSDIYYYIGDSWLSAKYNQNPYYVTVADLQNQGINDEILNNTGYWKNITSVYGPLYNIISEILVSFSFGSITIALFVFKFASYLIHVLNSYLMYKITKSRKYMLLYALNPLILIELLSNVHNDIYLLLFMLLAIYFVVRKKNIYFSIIFLAFSVSIKYSSLLLVPFILIYYFKDKTIPKRILLCIISGLGIIAIVIMFYMRYYQDYTIFTNMLAQGNKYSQSILSFLLVKSNRSIFELINNFVIPIFIALYGINVLIFAFKKKIVLKQLMKEYNFMMLIFIFLVLSTFQKWYVLWLIPTIMYQNKYMRKFILYLTITAIVPSFGYFLVEGDPYMLGISYSMTMLFISLILLLINGNAYKAIKERIKGLDKKYV